MICCTDLKEKRERGFSDTEIVVIGLILDYGKHSCIFLDSKIFVGSYLDDY
jgi:hypothetical protein